MTNLANAFLNFESCCHSSSFFQNLSCLLSDFFGFIVFIRHNDYIKLLDASALENKSAKFITFDSDFLQSISLKDAFKEVKIDEKT